MGISLFSHRTNVSRRKPPCVVPSVSETSSASKQRLQCQRSLPSTLSDSNISSSFSCSSLVVYDHGPIGSTDSEYGWQPRCVRYSEMSLITTLCHSIDNVVISLWKRYGPKYPTVCKLKRRGKDSLPWG
ncbi:hypothetical protein BaRGS_00002238 [Batillaria attramentaria]|uniref:Uncharacterized protein n=1 Tax=Batillaria attramentaria TaxID=370345 RepID=A0ABD0M6E9_9CAEN